MTPRLSIVFILLALIGCKAISTYPISEKRGDVEDNRLLGKWKAIEDTNRNNFYAVSNEVIYGDGYHIKFWNRGGSNPTYEGQAWLSEVRGVRFLNVPYWEGRFEYRGFFFLRLLNISADSITTCLVADTTMRKLKSSRELKRRIAGNLQKAAFYSDTVHFYRFR